MITKDEILNLENTRYGAIKNKAFTMNAMETF
ncbi:Uncharacterised protein [Sphingobacterium multivorum]|nr:Uncharacterised protein [Sphingobacterium multivorum]